VCDALATERVKLARELEDKEAMVSSAGGGSSSGNNGSGSGVMTREQFKAYGAQLRDKTALYKRYVQYYL
jgi:hypothetical protein